MNVIRMVPQELLLELVWLHEMSIEARETGRPKIADSWQLRAMELAREISGE